MRKVTTDTVSCTAGDTTGPGNSLLSRLRRITVSSRYVPEIDGIRFVAIALVFLYHLAGDILRHSPESLVQGLQDNFLFAFTQHGNFGVQLFFALSGFLLAGPFARQYLADRKPVSLKRYFLRRLTRLEPPYIMALTGFLILKIAGGRGSFDQLFPHFLASLFYQHNAIYSRPSDINFVAWSLEIEVQFYILAPWIAAILYRPRNPVARRAAIILVMMLVTWVSDMLSSPRMNLTLLSQANYFLAGFLLADFLVEVPNRTTSNAGWDAVVLAGASMIVVFHTAPFRELYIYLAPLAVALTYYAAFNGPISRRALSTPPVAVIGGMCYSIYLIHNYIIAVAGSFTEPLTVNYPFASRLIVQSFLLGTPVLILSGLFYWLVERPCMDPGWPGKLSVYLRRQLAKPMPSTF